MPRLKEKHIKYELHESFQKKVKFVCDLKSILWSMRDFAHLKSHCWPKFNLIFEFVFNTIFPKNPNDVNAEDTAGYLWATTEKIFKIPKDQDLQKCRKFYDFFFPLKVLDDPMNELKFSKNALSYQSCVFDIKIPCDTVSHTERLQSM